MRLRVGPPESEEQHGERTRKLARVTSAAFWGWIVYQTVKGITTTTLIWAPLAYLYFLS
jgi:hypothetical protein